ncbi:unnamed protein product [Phaedon cochleariae]|uniref:Uncharacterized protein n=1 Tax=Phaedon cochleariae TaxID=80249 RepID=A0A9N9SPL3_PHACE|nr:unnamed protein product [Phaedon cochleariae]
MLPEFPISKDFAISKDYAIPKDDRGGATVNVDNLQDSWSLVGRYDVEEESGTLIPFQSEDSDTKQSQSKAVTSRKPKAKNVNSQPPQTKEGEKPPPIIFDGILRDRKEIIPLIKSLTVKKIYFKYGNESTLLYTESTEDFENVKRRLKEDKVSFYRYALKQDKTHAFVLRGLDFEPEPSEIIEEMEQEHKIKVKEVYRLNTRYRPLYLKKTILLQIRGDSTLLYTETIEDFENVRKKLEEDEVAFYRYAPKKEKTHAFVLRGLDFEP